MIISNAHLVTVYDQQHLCFSCHHEREYVAATLGLPKLYCLRTGSYSKKVRYSLVLTDDQLRVVQNAYPNMMVAKDWW